MDFIKNMKQKTGISPRIALLIFTLIISGFLFTFVMSNKATKLKGDPIIVKKVVSMIPGYCTYTYEGWGRSEYFEDKCDKYNVGDKLIQNDVKD